MALPGGFGTLDEIFETATLIQTAKIHEFPLVLMGTDFWAPMVQFVRMRLQAEGTIGAADVERIVVTDSPAEAVARISEVAMTQFGLSYGPRLRRRWCLGEFGTGEKQALTTVGVGAVGQRRDTRGDRTTVSGLG